MRKSIYIVQVIIFNVQMIKTIMQVLSINMQIIQFMMY